MAEARRLGAPLAWAALAAVLATGAVLGGTADAAVLDWQPGRAAGEPWRAWSAAFVHYSRMHLLANLAGAALVAALGLAAPVPARAVLAWLAAWPLTHVGLALQPALVHYGGLSGVLHAGVAVIGVHVAASAAGRRRAVGVAILAGLAVKVLGEAPWGPPLRHPAGWDIAIAPLAHATGAVAGTLCSALAEWGARRAYHRAP